MSSVGMPHPLQMFYGNLSQHVISQLRIVRSGLHLVTYLDVGNFCDKSIKTTLPDIVVQVFLRSLIYELA